MTSSKKLPIELSTSSKITLKNLQIVEALSHETTCFTASVYVDGKRFCTAENRGQGGCNDYRHVEGVTYQDIRNLQEIAKQIGQEKGKDKWWDLDCLLGEIMDEMELMKVVKRNQDRKIYFRQNGEVYSIATQNPISLLIRHQKFDFADYIDGFILREKLNGIEDILNPNIRKAMEGLEEFEVKIVRKAGIGPMGGAKHWEEAEETLTFKAKNRDDAYKKALFRFTLKMHGLEMQVFINGERYLPNH